MTPDTGTYTLRRGDQSFGPYTAAEIAAYVATGNIVPSDSVFDHDSQQWLSVQSLLARYSTAPGAAGGEPVQAGARNRSPSERSYASPGGLSDPAPPPYGGYAAPPGGVEPDSRRGDAVTALVTGLLSMVCCGPLFGVLAIVFGARGMQDPVNRGMAIAGLVLGIVGLVLGSFASLIYLLGLLP